MGADIMAAGWDLVPGHAGKKILGVAVGADMVAAGRACAARAIGYWQRAGFAVAAAADKVELIHFSGSNIYK
jgi:hypothetical protein